MSVNQYALQSAMEFFVRKAAVVSVLCSVLPLANAGQISAAGTSDDISTAKPIYEGLKPELLNEVRKSDDWPPVFKVGKCGLSMEKAIELALARNPEVMSAAAIILREGANVSIAKSEKYPKISFGSGVGNTGGHGASNTNLTADLLLFDFGRADRSIDGALSSEERAKADLNVTAEKISSDTARAFLEVIRSVALRQQAETYIRSLEKLREIIEFRVNAGVADMADLIFAQVREDASQSALVEEQAQERAAISSLFNLTGEVFDCFSEPNLILSKIDQGLSIDELNSHPAVVSADREVDMYRHEAAAQRAALLPRFGVQARQQYDSWRGSEQASRDNNFSVMLTMQMDLYQGGAGKARVDFSEAIQNAISYKKDTIKMNSINQFNVASENAEGAKKQIPVIENIIEKSIASRDIFFEQYTLKKRSLMDLLISEMEINDASKKLVDAKYRWALSVVQKASAVGSLRKSAGLAAYSPQF